MFRFIILFFLFSFTLFANWKSDRENLQNVYQLNNFRVFYSLRGKNSLSDKSDLNRNNIPDIVENIALQLNVADQIYSNSLGFINPLKNKRYTNKVKYIDVHILNLQNHGSAGDSIIKYNYKYIKSSEKSISISVSNKIKFDNLTPAHELFHIYQNGYTMFKNRWYTEGTARWSEFLFKKGTGKQHKLPQNIKQIDNLLSRTYGAKFFWNRLLFLCAKNHRKFNISRELKKVVYIGSQQKVIEENSIHGYIFLLKIFQNLDYYDDVLSSEKGIESFSWKESEQKSFMNNKYILLAIKKSIEEYGTKDNEELVGFLKALNAYLVEFYKIENIKDITVYIKSIGIPYKNIYEYGEEIYARNVWDMHAYKGLLYIGAGNYSNSSPAPNAGSVPIISYDPKANTFTTEGKVDDEQIDCFRVLNDVLYIPGIDAIQNHQYGNYYFKKSNIWIKRRVIPKAIHIFDMMFFDNKLFAGISTPNGAAVATSVDNGNKWSIVNLGKKQRVYSLLKVQDKLYAFKQFKVDQDLKRGDFSVAEYRDGSFYPREDLKEGLLFPAKNRNRKKIIRISRSETLDDKAVYLAAYYYNNPFCFFVATSLEREKVLVEQIKISSLYIPRDLIIRDDIVYFLCSKKVGKRFMNIVLKSTKDNLTQPKELFYFESSAFARSFEYLNGNFYFGLGCDVKNKKRWKQKELKVNTGKIVKVSKGDI